MISNKVLFMPTQIGMLEIKNRFSMAPMGPLGMADAEGGFNQRGIDYYTRRAQGGTGLIITGVTFVENDVEKHGMPNVPCSTHNPVHFVRTGKEMTERIHAYNSKVFLQMSGGFGRVTIPTNLGDIPPVAPSPIQHRWLDKTCRELTVEEIKYIVKMFGEGAYNAQRAGFDGVQIHAVHEGYLIDQFAISMFNNRTDEYGGSLENRLRFAREIVEEIKRRCGEQFPVTVRYSPKSFIKDWREGALPGEDFEEKGRDLPEGIEVAKLLEVYGYDALDIDVGSYDSWWWSHPPMYQEKGLYREFAKLIKKEVSIPIICAGRMDNSEMALQALEDDVCDIISLGRPLLAEPDYVNKLRSGRQKEIRPCISCQEGCMGRIQEYSMLNCAVNPQACRERSTQYEPITKSKRILIVGGGVSGCEAARVLAIRGHKPVVYEKNDKLGGNLLSGGVPSFKEDDLFLAQWYADELDRYKVEVYLNREVTEAEIYDEKYDTVIFATGSTPKIFSLGNDSCVYSAADVLKGKEKCGEKVAVIGGGLVGCETALWLAEQGKSVTIVEALEKILMLNAPLCHANSEMLERLVPFHGINVIANAKAADYRDGILYLQGKDETLELECDSVILSVGYNSQRDLYMKTQLELQEVYLIGDARRVANIMYAIWDAFEVANHI